MRPKQSSIELSVQGMVRVHVAAKEHGVRIVVGSEVTVGDGSTVVLLA